MAALDDGASPRPAGWTTSRRSRSAPSSTAWSAWTTTGAVVRPALLWNDTRSAGAAADLVERARAAPTARGPTRVGSVPVASFTVTKLRWLAEHEPENAARTAAVCLPHDWLTLAARRARPRACDELAPTAATPAAPATGRRPPAATGPTCSSGRSGTRAVVRRACSGRPRPAGRTPGGAVAGAGHAATTPPQRSASAPGPATSSSRSAPPAWSRRSATRPRPTRPARWPASPTRPAASCRWSARSTPPGCSTPPPRLLGVDLDELSRLALSAPPAGAGGLVLVPYLEGERTPDRPDATGALHGLTLATPTRPTSPAPRSRGCCAGWPTASTPLRGRGRPGATGCCSSAAAPVGGGAARIAPAVLGCRCGAAAVSEYVADGAARQAAWTLTGGDAPPEWAAPCGEVFEADPVPAVRARYAEVRDLTAHRPGAG